MELPSTSRLNRGFALIELLVVIALMATLLGLGLLMSMDVLQGTTFRSTRETLVSVLTLARSRALANEDQSPWGVCYAPPNFVVFPGTAYVASNPANDILPGNPAVSLSSEGSFFTCADHTSKGIIFSQVGATSTGGSITITEPAHENKTVVVNSEGTIVW